MTDPHLHHHRIVPRRAKESANSDQRSQREATTLLKKESWRNLQPLF
jgi:hypothetical protein